MQCAAKSSGTKSYPLGESEGIRQGGDHTQIRDLTVAVAEEPADPGQTGNGITLNAIATLDHVTVKFFGNHGILVSAGVVPPATFGIAAGFVLDACVVGRCRGDGFHFVGSDANVGTIKACNAAFNRGFGFRDRTVINTYIGCHADGNLGLETNADDEMETVYRNYAAFGLPTEDLATSCNTNNCVYIGCYSEGDSPAVKNMIGAGATIIGGQPGYQQQPSIRDDLGETDLALTWAGWIISSNEVQGQPLSSVKVIPDPGDDGRRLTTTIEIGQKTDFSNLADPVTNEPGIFNFRLNGADEGVRNLTDFNRVRYDEETGWWLLEKPTGVPVKLAGDVAPPRRAAPLFSEGTFFTTTRSPATLLDRFGPPDPASSKEIVSHTATNGKPTAPVLAETWEVGDIAWDATHATPERIGPVGWRCIQAGTWSSAALTQTADVDIDDIDPSIITVTFKDGGAESFAGLVLWAYVKIGAAVVQIISTPTLEKEPDPNGEVLVRAVGDPPLEANGQAVEWAEPVLVPFGNESSRATAIGIELDDYDFHVDCTSAGITILLPPSPKDGARIEVQDTSNAAGPGVDEITVDGNGHDIDTAANATVAIDTPYQMLQLRYNATVGRWFTV